MIGKRVKQVKAEYQGNSKLGSWTKLAAIYCGPFSILDRIGPVAYKFALPTTIKTHNYHRLCQ
jgi:hypothetical protein